MSAESLPLCLIHSNGTRAEALLQIGNETPNLEHRVHLTLHFLGRRYQAHETDYFSALCVIRRELEKLDLAPECWGASLNVHVSAEGEQVSLGRYGCRLALGRPVLPSDYVCIFESGPGVEPATVDKQKAFHRQWLESLGWHFDHNGKMTGRTLGYNPYRPPAWVQMRLRVMDVVASFRGGPAAPAAG